MTPNLEERIHQIIISANKYAWDHYEIGLDLSENSITKLDSVIQIERLKAKESDSTKFDITKSSRVWGVYLGEIIRTTVGGIWLVEEGDLIFRLSEVDIYPIHHVEKILGGQSNLTVYSYFTDFCKKIDAGINVSDRKVAEKETNQNNRDKNLEKTDKSKLIEREYEELIHEIFPESENEEIHPPIKQEKISSQPYTPAPSEEEKLIGYRVWLAILGIAIVIGTFLSWITIKEGRVTKEIHLGITTIPGLITLLIGLAILFTSMFIKSKKPSWVVTLSTISVFGIPIFTWLVKDIWYYPYCWDELFAIDGVLPEGAVCAVSKLDTGFYFSLFFIFVLFIFTQVTRTRKKQQ